jgi:hypothetical protein
MRKKRNVSEDQRLDKAFELLTASASGMNDECQHFGHLVACKLRKYDESIRCAIQNDIMSIFLRASSGFYNNYSSAAYSFLNPSGPPTVHYPISSSPHYPVSFQSPTPCSSQQPGLDASPSTSYSPSAASPATASEDDFNIQDLL